MWGSTLDHIIEVEVVTAEGEVVRASETQNPDLFFALRGAGASFGIITEFVMRTNPEPGDVVEYTYTLAFDRHRNLGPVFKAWQDLVTDPNLDRRFGSEFVLHELGAMISTTFYGTEAEFEATGIPARIPSGKKSIIIDDWLGSVAQKAQESALWLSDISTPFKSKSVAFTPDKLLTSQGIDELMNYIDRANKGTLIWYLIFDVTGGAISDVPLNATAYRHRDTILFGQGYGVGIPKVSQTTRDFFDGIAATIQSNVNGTLGTYAGYVDPTLDNAQESYWGANLPRLEQIKRDWDPNNVFANPQSVQPAQEST